MGLTQTFVLQTGAAVLKQALASMGISVSDQAFFWLLGQAYGESGLGFGDMSHMPSGAANFKGTNNWGAVYCGTSTPKGSVLKAVPDASCVRGAGDTVPGGGKFVPNVTKFATPIDGAKGFVGLVMAIAGMPAVLANGSSTTNDYARTLYKVGYFGGCHVGEDGAKSLNQGMSFKSNADKLRAQVDADPNVMISCAGKRKGSSLLHATQAEADEANIKEYASMVDGMANNARKAATSPLLPGVTSTPILVASGAVDIPPSPLARAAKIGIGFGIAGGAAYGIAMFMKERTAVNVMTGKPGGNRKQKKGRKRRA
jgi:hypothetical protein